MRAGPQMFLVYFDVASDGNASGMAEIFFGREIFLATPSFSVVWMLRRKVAKLSSALNEKTASSHTGACSRFKLHEKLECGRAIEDVVQSS